MKKEKREVLFPKGLPKEELNRRRQVYLKKWRENHPGWNHLYARRYYCKQKGIEQPPTKKAEKAELVVSENVQERTNPQ